MLFTVILLSLVLTGLPFSIQVKFADVTGALIEHDSDLEVPAKRGVPPWSTDTMSAGGKIQ